MKTLALVTQDDVLWVWLRRPDVRNAFNAQLIEELTTVFTTLPQKLRAVVLAGEGTAFCAGADLQWMRDSAKLSKEENLRDATLLAKMFEAIDRAPYPTLGRLQGVALGGGVGLLACCDMVVAEADARMGLTEARLGLAPAVISPFVMAKTGVAFARRYFLTAELFSAAEACSAGLVQVVVRKGGLDAEIARLLGEIRKCGPQALRAIKQLLRDVNGRSALDVRDYTSQTIAGLRTGAEGQEGLQAFFEKREPRW